MKKIRKDLKVAKNARDNLFKAHNRRGVHVRVGKTKTNIIHENMHRIRPAAAVDQKRRKNGKMKD